MRGAGVGATALQGVPEHHETQLQVMVSVGAGGEEIILLPEFESAFFQCTLTFFSV